MLDSIPADVLREHVVPRLPPASAARFRAVCKHTRAAVPDAPRVTALAMVVRHAMAAVRDKRPLVVGRIRGRWVTAASTHAAIHDQDGTVEVHRWGAAWVVIRLHAYKMPPDIRQAILEAADAARVCDVYVTAPGRRWTPHTPRLAHMAHTAHM